MLLRDEFERDACQSTFALSFNFVIFLAGKKGCPRYPFTPNSRVNFLVTTSFLSKLKFIFLHFRICESDEADLSSLILTLCNTPVKVKFLERHIASILTASQRKLPNEWQPEAIGKLLQDVEDNGFNIDATEVFHRMGKEQGEPESLGKLVRHYLLANAEKDSFSCRCKTVECECPAYVDEGIAFIVFAGLERKMDWDEDSKLTFFRSATDTLWTPEILNELGKFSLGVLSRLP